MNDQFIKSILKIITSSLINVVISIIVISFFSRNNLNDESENENESENESENSVKEKEKEKPSKETHDQNISEIVWLWISIVLIVVLLIALPCIHFLITEIFSSVEKFVVAFSIINVCVGWDYFSRNEYIDERNACIVAFMFMFILFI